MTDQTPTTTPNAPWRVQKLPTDKHGRRVPWFVAWIDGTPDFRVIAPGKLEAAINDDLCWMCGQKLGVYKSFVIGPMCVVNCTTAEPPCHRDCAEYAARVCPFLTTPGMRRRDSGLPDETSEPAGHMIRRNPGACAVYTTTTYRAWSPNNDGLLLFQLSPTRPNVTWWAEGRPATRDEVDQSIRTGLPLLEEQCDTDDDRAALTLQMARAVALLPDPVDPIRKDTTP